MAGSEDRGVRSLRLSAALRTAIITYGIAAYSFTVSRNSFGGEGESPLAVLARWFAIGLGLQAASLLVRWLVKRYERNRGLEGQLMPLAMYIFELAVDGVTVFLFALATYRGIFATAASM